MTSESIYANDSIRRFLPELSNPHFRQEAAQVIEQDERMAVCRHMTARLPDQTRCDRIIRHIYEQGAVSKWLHAATGGSAFELWQTARICSA